MDRSMSLRHLAQVERHIHVGKKCIAQQEERVAALDVYWRDATLSRTLLDSFRALQEMHIAHRELILKELG
jgi:hypothetical protein